MAEIEAAERLLDRVQIEDVLARYCRAVDRGALDQLDRVYHSDGFDDHGEYRGDIPGLKTWLEDRFASVESSTHFLGSCLIEFAGPDTALVETYFISHRLEPVPEGSRGANGESAQARQAWGRYIDRFERRGDRWRIARRRVAIDSRSLTYVRDGERGTGSNWGRRDGVDPLWAVRSEMPELRGDI